MASSGRSRVRLFEQRFDRVLGQLRLIAILPVIMNLVSTGVTFGLGTREIGKAIRGLSPAADAVELGFVDKMLSCVVTEAASGGVDRVRP
jgi:hypothetical protein